MLGSSCDAVFGYLCHTFALIGTSRNQSLFVRKSYHHNYTTENRDLFDAKLWELATSPQKP